MARAIPAALALTAAVLGLGGPVTARDFEKAPTVPAAVPCPSKGPGFVRVPGGGCIRVSGRVIAGTDLRAAGHGPSSAPVVAGQLAIDNRADTDLGEVRTYVRIGNGRR